MRRDITTASTIPRGSSISVRQRSCTVRVSTVDSRGVISVSITMSRWFPAPVRTVTAYSSSRSLNIRVYSPPMRFTSSNSAARSRRERS